MCIWAHQWQDSWSLRDVLCRETEKLKHVSTNKMMCFFFFWLFCCLWIIYIYIYTWTIHRTFYFCPSPCSYLNSWFVPQISVRTFYFCIVCFLWFRVFLFYTATGLRFGFKRHMLKLHWIGQVWLRWVQVGPLNPLLEMFEKFGD